MPVESRSQLLRYRRQDVYAGERELVHALNQLATEEPATLADLRTAKEETQKHVQRLEEVFSEFGE